jgi:hypothetical protein
MRILPVPLATEKLAELAVVHAPPTLALPQPLATDRVNVSEAKVLGGAGTVTVTESVTESVRLPSSFTVSVTEYVPETA